MKPNKPLGPIDVATSDITPITHQKIDKVTGHDWANLPSSHLIDQLTTLHSRRITLLGLGKDTAAQQIQYGIDSLQKAIDNRLRFEENLTKSKNSYYNATGQQNDDEQSP
jgi:hypothetical protein